MIIELLDQTLSSLYIYEKSCSISKKFLILEGAIKLYV